MKLQQGIISKKAICSDLFREGICKRNIFTIEAVLNINLLNEIKRYRDGLYEQFIIISIV